MKYARLSINSQKSKEDFEYVRWHVITYILRQGDVVIRSSNVEGINRPSWNEEEFGTIVFHGTNEGFYSFHIEPRQRGKNRNLQIAIGCANEKQLEQRVSEVIKNTQLERK